MRYLKTYEAPSYFSDRETLLSSVACYLEEQQPVSKEEGFIECLFDSNENFCFTFLIGTDEEDFDKFYEFLKNNKLKIHEEFSTGDRHDQWEIQIKLSEKKIKEYANIYDNSQKYNL